MRCTASSGCSSRLGRIGEPEQLGEVAERARALLAADHREVRLVAVEPGEEDDAGLVEARRRLEDVARQRHGGREDGVEALVSPAASAASAALAAGAIASKMPSSASLWPCSARAPTPSPAISSA